MRDELRFGASEEAGDIHDRDTVRVATGLRAATLRTDEGARSRERDSDGPPTVRVPLVREQAEQAPTVAPAHESSRPTQPGLLAAPVAGELSGSSSAPPTELDEDDTRPYPLEALPGEIRIPIAPVPRELASLAARASFEAGAGVEGARGVSEVEHATPLCSAIVEIAPPRPDAALGIDATSSLAPAVRSARPEPKRPAGAAILLVAVLVPLASAASLLVIRDRGVAGSERSAAAVAPRSERAEPSATSVRAADDRVAQAPVASAGVSSGASVAAPAPEAPENQPFVDASRREGLARGRRRAGLDSAAMPGVPGREDVVAALEPLREAIEACAAGRHGIAQVDVSVNGSGSVAHAVVGGDFAGSPQGSCIARELRKAQFHPFQQARFRVLYPFSL